MKGTDISLSLIIPVFNRPAEVEELLESLTTQSCKNFEVIVVEDGSQHKCDTIVERYKSQLEIKYFYKDNSGPGQSRNYGFERASGNYGVFLDSDCILPPQYVEVVYNSLTQNYTDAWGGPDRAHKSFTNIQKAINYAMTSFFTTGGIRGGGEKMDKFYPRSFNMGYSKEVFEKTKGFSKMRFGEDIDMSIRIIESGFKTKLIKDAFVFHKRRTNLRQFFKQIHNSGIARINLYKKHPQSLKAVHALPALFTLSCPLLLVLALIFSLLFLIPLALYILILFVDAAIRNKSLWIGCLAIVAGFIQLWGYGAGFMIAFWKRIVLGKDEFSAFKNTFYK